MRLPIIATTLAILLSGTAGFAQDNAMFRMNLGVQARIGVDVPDMGTNDPVQITVTIPAASRMPQTVTVPVEISGMAGTDRIEVSGIGFQWTPGGAGKGAITWLGGAAGDHVAMVQVLDENGTSRGIRQVIIRVHAALAATVPQTAYSVDVGGTLTVTPDVTGAIDTDAVRWGSTNLPSTWGFNDRTGAITVDTASARSVDNIVLTAIDQNDWAAAPTQSFKVEVAATCTWIARSAPQQNNWTSVTYGGGQFVAVASGGTGRIMTSPDGVTWTARTPPEQNGWQSVAYGGGQFVAVAASGTNRIMTSPDGVSWTARSAPEQNNWYSVTYGGGQFVAIAGTGTNRIMTSPDGVTWTARSAPEQNEWRSVTYGGAQFVAVSIASTGTNRIMTSPDGVTWTARSAPEQNNWRSVTYGGGQFVAIATSGTNRIMTSPSGITWTARSAPEQNSWQSVTYGGGQFIAIATSGTNQIMTSPDGVSWTARTPPEQNNWVSVTYGGGQFVAVANGGTNRIMTGNCD